MGRQRVEGKVTSQLLSCTFSILPYNIEPGIEPGIEATIQSERQPGLDESESRQDNACNPTVIIKKITGGPREK